MKEKTSQDLALPLFIGAIMGLISAIPLISIMVSTGQSSAYEVASLVTSLATVVLYTTLGILIKMNRINGDWNVLISFIVMSILLYLITGVSAVVSNDNYDLISITPMTTGAVDIIVAVLLAGMLIAMIVGKINAVSRFIFYSYTISVIVVVLIAACQLIDVCVNLTDAGAMMSAFGGLINKTLIAIVLINILLKRDEVKNRLFSNGLKNKDVDETQ